ncbi:hypothetical protein E2C01_016720 [Portunus trituberculatus]|uniref:Uncharacterized protein n=1 Tax=Portunus trituberculatus TaxID=210409 RepID=A0A5B7DPV1_PORTR|nr:hypothetical protein [Portunus trituberculatus]
MELFKWSQRKEYKGKARLTAQPSTGKRKKKRYKCRVEGNTCLTCRLGVGEGNYARSSGK